MAPRLDLTGMVFGLWTVVATTDRRNSAGGTYYACRCACGTEREVLSRKLRRGLSGSCGCVTSRKRQHSAAARVEARKDREAAQARSAAALRYDSEAKLGAQFGYLTIKQLIKKTRSTTWWLAVCRCEREVIISAGELKHDSHFCPCRLGERTLRDQMNRRLRGYKRAARHRGHTWTISGEEAREMFQAACAYCGQEATSQLSGIDRRDNDKGYDKENVLSCCWTCNRAKYVSSESEFRAWIQRLVDRQLDNRPESVV